MKVTGLLFDEKLINVILFRTEGSLDGLNFYDTVDDFRSNRNGLIDAFFSECNLRLPVEATKFAVNIQSGESIVQNIFKLVTPSLLGISRRDNAFMSSYAISSVLHPSNYLGLDSRLRFVIPLLLDQTIKFPLTIKVS